MTKFNQAIIIGASSGIGEALARELVNNGCIVALVARRGDLLDKLCSEINSNSDKIKAYSYVHDVVNIDEVPELFQVITRQLGRLDAIFYTAGTMAKITKDEYDTSKDSLMIKVNTIGAIAWINEAARRFERIKKGTIVGVSSVAGDREEVATQHIVQVKLH